MKQTKRKRLDSDGLWQYALKALGGRAQSTGELRERLRMRAENIMDVDSVLARLKDLGYLNDKRFAEGYAAARLANDKLGSNRVVQDLRRRRVAPVLAETTVQQTYQDVDEVALIEAYIRRKYRMTEREGLFGDEKDLGSAYRRLARAGFRSGEIIRVLKRFAKDPDLMDAFEPPEEPVDLE
jgi:regulatory protein